MQRGENDWRCDNHFTEFKEWCVELNAYICHSCVFEAGVASINPTFGVIPVSDNEQQNTMDPVRMIDGMMGKGYSISEIAEFIGALENTVRILREDRRKQAEFEALVLNHPKIKRKLTKGSEKDSEDVKKILGTFRKLAGNESVSWYEWAEGFNNLGAITNSDVREKVVEALSEKDK